MASLFEGLDTPKFIGPFEQMQMATVEAQAVGRNFLGGMQLALEAKQLQNQHKQQLVKNLMDFQKLDDNNRQLNDIPKLNAFAKDPTQDMPKFEHQDSFKMAESIRQNWEKTSAGETFMEAHKEYFAQIKNLTASDRIMVESMMMEANKGKTFQQWRVTPEIAKYIDDSLERSPYKKPAVVVESEIVTRKLQEADQLDSIGNTERAASLRREATEIQSRMVPPSETIETYTDAEGKQQFRIKRGGVDKGPLTTATTTQVQERLIGSQKMVDLSNKVLSTLTAADVGVAGNVNQVLINEGLAQLIPGAFKGQVAEGRALLGMFNQEVIKTMRGSGERITEADIKRYTRFLPKAGLTESVESAKQKISTFLDQVRKETQTDALAANLPIPEWSLTRDQILEGLKSGAISREKAIDLLQKYHKDFQLTQ